MVRGMTSIAGYRDLKSLAIRNDTGHLGHPAMTPATGSFQA
jgi:hypothetical protein